MKNQSLAVFLTVLFLSACSSGEPGTPPLKLDYSQFGKINLDIQNVTIVDRDAGPSAQSVSFQPSIGNAVRQWANDRLQGVGTSGQGIVEIKDANVTALSLATEGGFDNWFKRQQASKYVGHVSVEIEVKGRGGYGVATAEASRTVTLPEDPSDMERHEAYNRLIEGMMADLNANLDQSIHEHLQDFIITAPVPAEAPSPPPSVSVMPMPLSPNRSP
jgi:hypothetical protein